MISKTPVKMLMPFVIDHLKLNQHCALFLYPAFQLSHKASANAFILLFHVNYNLHQIIGKTVIILLKISHCESDYPLILFQYKTIGILTGQNLVNTLICGLDRPLTILFSIVIIHVQGNQQFYVCLFHFPVCH